MTEKSIIMWRPAETGQRLAPLTSAPTLSVARSVDKSDIKFILVSIAALKNYSTVFVPGNDLLGKILLLTFRRNIEKKKSFYN
jgi:hypothetical protein